MMRLLQGLNAESNNETKKSNNNNQPWFGRVPGVSSSRKAAGPAAPAAAASAAGQGQRASQGNISEKNKKVIDAFKLYGTTKEELTKLGEQGKSKIKKAFVKIAVKNHPDKWQQKPNNNKKAATARFQKYSEARDIIAKAMGWAENFKSEQGGGTRRRRSRNRKTRKN